MLSSSPYNLKTRRNDNLLHQLNQLEEEAREVRRQVQGTSTDDGEDFVPVPSCKATELKQDRKDDEDHDEAKPVKPRVKRACRITTGSGRSHPKRAKPEQA